MNINVRHEIPADIESIEAVTTQAFLNAPHTDHTEQFIVRALREADALTVSLVAEVEGKVVGHVAVSPVTLSDGSSGWFGLGPISVLPDHQRAGVGSRLMRKAIETLNNMNASGCVLLGDPMYYSRFGFKPVASIVLPGVPAEYFMALAFDDAFPSGDVAYHEAFNARS